MPSALIQWFPGHMAKTRRMITEQLSKVDLVLELRDARIPVSSKNPEIAHLVGQKPILTLYTKTSLADPRAIAAWKKAHAKNGTDCLFVDSVTGEGIRNIPDAVKALMKEKLQRYQEKNMVGRRLKAMVVGIPNVGKSSLINRLAKAGKAKVEDRPGVTKDKQWIDTDYGLTLLDMPGILWPKFEDQTVGMHLAITGAVKDDILDTEEIARALCARLKAQYPNELAARYKFASPDLFKDDTPQELFERIGRKRGFFMAGGVIDTLRTATMLLDEFRGAKIGKMTLEWPSEEA
jgi:ribosome biogenesis GTPase A